MRIAGPVMGASHDTGRMWGTVTWRVGASRATLLRPLIKYGTGSSRPCTPLDAASERRTLLQTKNARHGGRFQRTHRLSPMMEAWVATAQRRYAVVRKELSQFHEADSTRISTRSERETPKSTYGVHSTLAGTTSDLRQHRRTICMPSASTLAESAAASSPAPYPCPATDFSKGTGSVWHRHLGQPAERGLGPLLVVFAAPGFDELGRSWTALDI